MLTNEFANLKGFRPQVSRSLSRGSQLLRDIGGSFSAALGNSFRQTVAGILSHAKMKEDLMLSSHLEQTKLRISESPGDYVIVAQDTTCFNYNGHTSMSDLGYLQGNHLGIYQHNGLAISEKGVPLGVVHQEYWSRESPIKSYSGKESQKWFRGLKTVNDELSECGKKVVLVQDREADIFDFFKATREPAVELLVRVYQPRYIEIKGVSGKAKLNDMCSVLPVLGTRQLQIWRNNKDITLTLNIRMSQVNILPDRDKSAARHKTQGLSLVIAQEIAAVDRQGRDVFDAEKVALWYLLTSIEVESFEKACLVCDFYALRWRVERFHYTLKTGSANVENLQFDDLQTTINAISFYSIIAWEVLYLVYLVRENENQLVTEVYPEKEIQLLAMVTKKEIKTVKDYALALGKLVGFATSKKQPMPGVKAFSNALERFHYIKIGARNSLDSKPLQD